MRKKIFSPMAVMVFLALLVASLSAMAAPKRVLIVERSTNRNRLVYEVDLNSDNPVRAHWLMLEEDGRREELTSFERSHVYGATVIHRLGRELTFSVKGLPSQPITVQENGDELEASLLLDQKRQKVTKLYLHLGSGLFPKIEKLEVVSENLEQLQ